MDIIINFIFIKYDYTKFKLNNITNISIKILIRPVTYRRLKSNKVFLIANSEQHKFNVKKFQPELFLEYDNNSTVVNSHRKR